MAAIQKPSYLSEGKVLVESQSIAPDLVKQIATATASERIQLIQQRIFTRENLLAVASKFGLFPNQPGIVDLMRKNTDSNPRISRGSHDKGRRQSHLRLASNTEAPELAMRVASEFVSMIVNEDERSRTSRSTEAVKILTAETKEIEDKLESTQMQISEIARRPHDAVPEIPEQQKSQLTAFAALKSGTHSEIVNIFGSASCCGCPQEESSGDGEVAYATSPVVGKSSINGRG